MYIDRVIELPDSELAEETKHKYLILKVGINESEHIFKGASDDLKEADKIARQEKGMVYRRFMSGKYGEAISPFYKSYTIMKYTKTSTETVGNFKTLEEADAYRIKHSMREAPIQGMDFDHCYDPMYDVEFRKKRNQDENYRKKVHSSFERDD